MAEREEKLQREKELMEEKFTLIRKKNELGGGM